LKGWWIYLLPLLYFPNVIGFNGATPIGVLELMDVVIFPLLGILIFLKTSDKKNMDLKPYKLLRQFIIWLILGALIFPLKFDYPDSFPWLLTISKVAKFGLYIFFGYMVTLKYKSEYFNKYLLSLIVIGVFMAYSNVFLKYNMEEELARLLFSADNVLAVALAALLSFFTYLAVYGKGIKRSVKLALLCSIPLILLGLLLSDGRAAIGAYVISIGVMFLLKINSPKVWVGVILASGLIVVFYFTQADFRGNLDRTINPSDEYLRKNKMDGYGFDDGKRFSGISNEFPKYWENPIFGTGFFHRGYKTGLMAMGSHNYYLQMLLESGIVGFIFIMGFLKYLWTSSFRKKGSPVAFAFFLSLISVYISSFTGEYLYASEALMMLILLMVPFLHTIKSNITINS